MKYYLNTKDAKKYRFIYDNEDSSVVYSRKDLDSDFENIYDLQEAYIKLKDYGKFKPVVKSSKHDRFVGKFERFLCSYDLHLEDNRRISVDMYLYFNKNNKLRVRFVVSFYNSGNPSKDFRRNKKFAREAGFKCVQRKLSLVGRIKIPVRMGYYLIDMADNYDTMIVHQFDDLMCMKLNKILYNLRVKDFEKVNW